MNGSHIEKIYTLGTKYDSNCVAAVVNGRCYRIKVEEFMQFLNADVKVTPEKKVKHTYLTLEAGELCE